MYCPSSPSHSHYCTLAVGDLMVICRLNREVFQVQSSKEKYLKKGVFKIPITSVDAWNSKFQVQSKRTVMHFWKKETKWFLIKLLLTLLTWIRICGHLHVVGREETCHTIEFSLPPVSIIFAQHVNKLPFGEAELVFIVCHVIIHCYYLTHYEEKAKLAGCCDTKQ